MPSTYPGTLDNLADPVSGTLITAAYVGSHADAVNAIESTLGTNPQGSYSTVRDRIADVKVRGVFSALVVKSDAVSPNTKVDLAADSVVMYNGTATLEARAINLVADITVSGLNGLDTGARAANQWYYVWAISNGLTTGSLLSLSSTAPTMPSGYTFKKLVGAVRTDGSSNLLNFMQSGTDAFYMAANSILSGGTSTVWTSVGLGSYVPPLATAVFLLGFMSYNTGGGPSWYTLNLGSNNQSMYAFLQSYGGSYAFTNAAQFLIPLSTAQTVYYYLNSSYGSAYLYVQGYRLPL